MYQNRVFGWIRTIDPRSNIRKCVKNMREEKYISIGHELQIWTCWYFYYGVCIISIIIYTVYHNKTIKMEVKRKVKNIFCIITEINYLFLCKLFESNLGQITFFIECTVRTNGTNDWFHLISLNIIKLFQLHTDFRFYWFVYDAYDAYDEFH